MFYKFSFSLILFKLSAIWDSNTEKIRTIDAYGDQLFCKENAKIRLINDSIQNLFDQLSWPHVPAVVSLVRGPRYSDWTNVHPLQLGYSKHHRLSLKKDQMISNRGTMRKKLEVTSMMLLISSNLNFFNVKIWLITIFFPPNMNKCIIIS